MGVAGTRWVPLSDSLQTSICFLFHRLSTRDFGRCYLGLTTSIRPLVDSVGLKSVVPFSFLFPLGGIYSAMGFVFIRLTEVKTVNPPIYLLVSAYQPYLAPFRITQFKGYLTYVHHWRLPFAP